MLPALGRLRATDLTSEHIDGYKRRRLREDAAPATINRELEHVRAALRAAMDDGWLVRIPKIRLFPEQNTRDGLLEEKQYRALRDVLRERYPYLWPLLVVGYHTGARLGELLALRWDQVDWERNQIRLHQPQTKGKEARTLPIYGDMHEALREALRDRNEYFPECRWIFNRAGGRIVDFRKAWSTACRLAGVEGLQFHDLRRSATVMMDRAGIPHDVSRQITGHKTDAMRRRYRIVPEKELQQAGETIERYLERIRAETAGEDGEYIQ